MNKPQTVEEIVREARGQTEAPDACVIEATSSEVVAFIEFQPDQRTRIGFSAGQLMQYRLETRMPGKDASEQPQVLTLGFSTADVIITGRRLESVTKLVAENRIKILVVQPNRLAELRPTKSFISKIEIKILG
jgi:hypothetical protein